jgi:hypothetical protein
LFAKNQKVMGKKNQKPNRVAKVAKDAPSTEIKWKFTYQKVPEGHACPIGLDYVLDFKTQKSKARIPNPWELWVYYPKAKTRYKVEVRKGDNAADVRDALKNEVGGLFHLVFKVSKKEISSSMKSADLFAIKNDIEIQEQEEPLQEVDQTP